MKKLGAATAALLISMASFWAPDAAADLRLDLAAPSGDPLIAYPWIPTWVEIRVRQGARYEGIQSLEFTVECDTPEELILLEVESFWPGLVSVGNDWSVRLRLDDCLEVEAFSELRLGRILVAATDRVRTSSLSVRVDAEIPDRPRPSFGVDCEEFPAPVASGDTLAIRVDPAWNRDLLPARDDSIHVDTGTLVVSGELIEGPYDLVVRGTELFINGRLSYRQPEPWDPASVYELSPTHSDRIAAERRRLEKIEELRADPYIEPQAPSRVRQIRNARTLREAHGIASTLRGNRGLFVGPGYSYCCRTRPEILLLIEQAKDADPSDPDLETRAPLRLPGWIWREMVEKNRRRGSTEGLGG